MLQHKFNQAQLNDFALCVIQGEYMHIEQEIMKANQGQSEEEEAIDKNLLLQNVHLRISAILPAFPLIEMDAIEAFFERGVNSVAPLVYHAVPATMNCKLTKAQMDDLFRCAFRAENLVTVTRIENEGGTVIPTSEIDEADKGEVVVRKAMELLYYTVERLRTIIPHFPAVHPNAVYDLCASELNGTPFVYFDRDSG